MGNTGDFATEVPGEIFDVEGDIVKIFLVLSFGFLGSPGEFQVLAQAAELTHESYTPEDAFWNGLEASRNFFLVSGLVSDVCPCP